MERRKDFCNISDQADLKTFNAEKDRHTLRECKECVGYHREHSANLPLPATPNGDDVRRFLQKTPNTTSKNDIIDVF